MVTTASGILGGTKRRCGPTDELTPAAFHDYLGAWAILPTRYVRWPAAQVLAHIARFGVDQASNKPIASYGVSAEGTAVIEIRGVMVKYPSLFGREAATVSCRRKVLAAANDPFVKSIVLVIDSPGGTVAGTQSLAHDVAAGDTRSLAGSLNEKMATLCNGSQGEARGRAAQFRGFVRQLLIDALSESAGGQASRSTDLASVSDGRLVATFLNRLHSSPSLAEKVQQILTGSLSQYASALGGKFRHQVLELTKGPLFGLS